jgi:hypothetical protein
MFLIFRSISSHVKVYSKISTGIPLFLFYLLEKKLQEKKSNVEHQDRKRQDQERFTFLRNGLMLVQTFHPTTQTPYSDARIHRILLWEIP